MNRPMHAIKTGLRRGWNEFQFTLRSAQDNAFNVAVTAAVLIYLWMNRKTTIWDTGLLTPQFALPGILGGLLAFLAVVGPAIVLAQEREDGTLLRMLAVPRGILGYQAGQLLLHVLNVVPLLLMIVLPGLLLFPDAMPSSISAWATVAAVAILGLAATLPLGIIVGVLLPSSQKVFTFCMAPTMAVMGISGLILPLQSLWGWVQVVAQVFPVYWIGHGIRAAFLPESSASIEVTGAWRLWETFTVLGLWAVVGAVLAPVVLRRMSRRQSGSSVLDARDAASQAIQ